MYIDQDDTSIPEPFKVSDSYEIEFEGYADGLFEQVTVSIPMDVWEDFKKNVVNA
ncbi:hypothetical protein [Nonomuraea sp. NPDC049129]|uniref:hypothetical protein n=1 Tax=Nonomuraea sp. NPDC049129 TaxID=3155272 RepID=UPI0033FFF656